MGRGDNRRSRKMIRRISGRKYKARIKRAIEEGKAKAGGSSSAAKSTD
ncbi:hypothetical protein N9D31_00155 [Oligoflexaceae bacterium]|nr:hypothetical protein [Oligoflexaceae bacterium]